MKSERQIINHGDGEKILAASKIMKCKYIVYAGSESSAYKLLYENEMARNKRLNMCPNVIERN